MLIVNTSVSGAFYQLHHSPFLTKQITFADVTLFLIAELIVDGIPYFSPLCRILCFNFKTLLSQIMSSNNILGRTRFSVQLCCCITRRSTHSISRSPSTNCFKFLRQCCSTLLDVAVPFHCNRSMVVYKYSILQQGLFPN
jgi:hypothetical protein